MKTLKLQVGKTYRSREGKEVKIVEYDGGLEYPYRGSDGEWYAESGKWSSRQNPYDLIEEVTRHTFKIPEGVRRVTVEQVGNRIVVEMTPAKEPQPYDAAERCRIMDFLKGYSKNIRWSHEQLCMLIEKYLKHKEGEK